MKNTYIETKPTMPSKDDSMGIEKYVGGWRTSIRIRNPLGKIVERACYGKSKEALKASIEKTKAEIRGMPVVRSLKCNQFQDVLGFYTEQKGPFCPSHAALVKLLSREIGTYPINDFSNRFRRYLLLGMKGKSPAWYNRRLEVIKAAFVLAVDSGLVSDNPISGKVFTPKNETPRDIMLSPEEVGRIILTAATNRRTCHIARYLQFVFQVPSRKTEIITLKISDVDFFNKAVRVRNGTTKTDKGTWKPIPPNMYKWFRWRLSVSVSLDEPVFCRFIKGTRKNRNKKRIVKPLGDFKTAWNTVRIKAGYPELHIHDSRHVSASQLLDNGTPAQVVQAVAGWSSDMLKIYYNRDSKRTLPLVCFNKRADSCEGSVKERGSGNG